MAGGSEPVADAVRTSAELADRLRAAGAVVPPPRVQAMVAALGELGTGSIGSLYWAGRLTLCAGPEDIDRYDQVFDRFVGRRPPLRNPGPKVPVRRLAAMPGDAGAGSGEDRSVRHQVATASRREILRHRDLGDMSAAERAEARKLLAGVPPAPPRRVSRRLRPSRRGPVDPHRTVRAMLRHGGETADVRRYRRIRRPRRLVLLVDVSGSMAPYADLMLRFAHAAVVARPTTDVFTLGTRLTRITRELRGRDPAAAMARVAAAVPDWSGGTRLGSELKEFLDRWGQRGTARGAVVVIASDGWERGGATLLGTEAARLARLAARVVWVNPHCGRDGYVPLTGGMRAVLPWIDELVAGDSLAALERLAAVVDAAARPDPVGRRDA